VSEDRFPRLGELTRIRNDFVRAIQREPGRRAELGEQMSRVEEARFEETLRHIKAGVPDAELKTYLAQPHLLSPAETGIAVPVGEAEAHFGTPEPEAEAEARFEPEAGI
jgi:hypothetical protein